MIKENTLAKISIIAGLTAVSLFGIFVLRALKSREQNELDEAQKSFDENTKVREPYVPKFKDGIPTLPKNVDDSYRDETVGSPFDNYEDEEDEDEISEDYNPNVERFAVGDGEGQISKHSPEYQTIINTAYGRSMNNAEYVLELVGKTFGLGARGEVFDTQDGDKGRRFNAEEIEKLRAKLLSDNVKSETPTAEEE